MRPTAAYSGLRIKARSPSPGKASCRSEGENRPWQTHRAGSVNSQRPCLKEPRMTCASGRSNADPIVKTRWIDCRNNKLIFPVF